MVRLLNSFHRQIHCWHPCRPQARHGSAPSHRVTILDHVHVKRMLSCQAVQDTHHGHFCHMLNRLQCLRPENRKQGRSWWNQRQILTMPLAVHATVRPQFVPVMVQQKGAPTGAASMPSPLHLSWNKMRSQSQRNLFYYTAHRDFVCSGVERSAMAFCPEKAFGVRTQCHPCLSCKKLALSPLGAFLQVQKGAEVFNSLGDTVEFVK